MANILVTKILRGKTYACLAFTSAKGKEATCMKNKEVGGPYIGLNFVGSIETLVEYFGHNF